MPNNLLERIQKLLIYLLLGLIILGISHIFLNNAKKINLNLPGGEYKFYINIFPIEEEMYIYDFMINYNYSNNMGNIYFYIGGKKEVIQNMEFRLPENSAYNKINLSTKQKDFNCISNETVKELNLTDISGYDCIIAKDKNYLNIYEFHDLSEDRIYVNISFNGSIIPNGYFSTDFANNIKLKGKGFFMDFDKGHYDCKPYCFVDYWDRLEYLPEGNHIKIATRMTEEGNRKSPAYEKFILNTYDVTLKEKKEKNNSIGIGLLIASIVFFAEGIIKLIS